MVRSSGAIVVCLCASLSFAGPEWPEVGDAGGLPGSAQTVTGGGGLITKINGELEGPPGLPGAGLGDFEDMYLIFIKDPVLFRASTLPEDGGFAEFDPALYLFNLDGTGLLANEDVGGGMNESVLLGNSNDGSGAFIPAPGLYYLAISGFGTVPLGGVGLQTMFDITPGVGEISGADGLGGGTNPITDWTGPGQFGLYSIALEGVSSVVPAPASVFGLSGLMLLGRHRKRS